MNDWLDVQDKVIVVTGGASGIGAAICKELKENGAIVISADRSYKKQTAHKIPCDITNADDVQHMFDQVINTYDKIDGLVNNAGMSMPRLLVDSTKPYSHYEMDLDFVQKIFTLNVFGTFLCAQAAARIMIKQESGVIINISSECGKEGSNAQSAYSATKGAVESFTRSWAKELGSYGIRVVAVAPGPMEATALWSEEYKRSMSYCRNVTMSDVRRSYQTSTLLHREGRLEEVANTVAFLLSDRASYITGTTINVSGGKSRG